jgi:hypothetical protein
MAKRGKRWMTVVNDFGEFWKRRSVVNAHFQVQG